MKKIITCLFAAFICFGLVTQQADTKSWKKILKPDKKESKQDQPAENKDSKQAKPADTKESKESKEQPKKGKYNIGDKGPGGGIVFHVAGNTYFEVSPLLLGECNWDKAISIAKNYKGGGFTNWQLPTKEQLNLIYVNLMKSGIAAVGGRVEDLGSGWYWSSSEYSGCACAWTQGFVNGVQGPNDKTGTSSVRAVRAFTP